MAKEKAVSAKKQARQQIVVQLQTALPGILEALGQKEFDSRLKKVSKILTEGIKVKSPKKAKEVKKVKIKQADKEKAA
ncbi:hypothetical protein LZZ85_07035 [Terrimonas sp. NA20]|uniref:Histone H1 n=1 Tax=Terrimonas ginsenosidimutans TaxID=2908004 RepID=A0ABS9KNX3_9BACT|nr:hypothetical protein [Terrimonas ginsenosidimutans]MCG2614028.1 hypothetical protein [Terrimonas ginsenosidimutans]